VLISDLVNRIVLGGKEVVPLISEYLKNGEQVDFGGGMSISGGLMKSFPDLKTALAYSLFSMEEEGAKAAYYGFVKDGADLPVLNRLLSLHRQLPDDKGAKTSLRAAAIRGARMLSELEVAPDPSKNYYGLLHFMNSNIKNLEASAAVPYLEKTIKGDAFDWTYKRGLLQTVSNIAPDRAADMIIEQYRDEAIRKWHPITTVTTNFYGNLPSTASVIEKVVSSGAMNAEERKVLFSSAGNMPKFAFRMRKVDNDDARRQIDKWVGFLRRCESAETDEGVLNAIRQAIKTAEEEIKRRN
jgi:hypothetical protein